MASAGGRASLRSEELTMTRMTVRPTARRTLIAMAVLAIGGVLLPAQASGHNFVRVPTRVARVNYSSPVSVSANGRFIAYMGNTKTGNSTADQKYHIFVYDRLKRQTEPIDVGP